MPIEARVVLEYTQIVRLRKDVLGPADRDELVDETARRGQAALL
jgi:hypothetical protein